MPKINYRGIKIYKPWSKSEKMQIDEIDTKIKDLKYWKAKIWRDNDNAIDPAQAEDSGVSATRLRDEEDKEWQDQISLAESQKETLKKTLKNYRLAAIPIYVQEKITPNEEKLLADITKIIEAKMSPIPSSEKKTNGIFSFIKRTLKYHTQANGVQRMNDIINSKDATVTPKEKLFVILSIAQEKVELKKTKPNSFQGELYAKLNEYTEKNPDTIIAKMDNTKSVTLEKDMSEHFNKKPTNDKKNVQSTDNVKKNQDPSSVKLHR